MKYVLVALLAGLCAASAASVDSTNFGKRQQDVWRLFKHINQPSYYKDHVDMVEKFNYYEHKDLYKKVEVVENFHQYYKYETHLKKGEIFSVFNEVHLKQAIALFKLFYYANDYETFYKTAVWARMHVNEGMFLYSFSVALIHKPETYDMVLPPIFEIYPHYFFNTEVIQKAQYYKQMFNGQEGSKYNDMTIHANYSGHYLNLHPEQSMSYFMEDVEVNAFYYYYNLYYPRWMSGEEFHLKNDNRGEMFYHMYQQILARFYLERLSNDFGEIEFFNWETPFPVGYYPSMQYPNGLEFPTRPQFAKLYEYFYNYGQKWSFKSKYGYSLTYVRDYERRIRDVVDSGYIFTHEGKIVNIFTEKGMNILGNLIESNRDSLFYSYYGAYQVFARHLLGYSYQALDQHKLYPSALEHFETSMRDPAFYMLYKKLITYFYRYKYQHVKPYTETDLYYNGVNIEKVEFDRLITYFEYFNADLTNAVYVTPEEFTKDTFKVQVAQPRLAHNPFTYKVHIKSDKEVDGIVKVFLGPKYDEYGRYINLTENWMNFVQFDHFEYKLKSGENTIVRYSKEIYNYMHDRTTFYELYKKAFGVYDKEQSFQAYGEQIFFGFPQRMMLPKGDFDGVTYQFYVVFYKNMEYKHKTAEHMVGSGNQYVDGYPMGYPLDRPVQFEKMFYDMPNGFFYEAKIYHKIITTPVILTQDGRVIGYGFSE